MNFLLAPLLLVWGQWRLQLSLVSVFDPSGQPLANPWTGGLQAPQIAKIDLDGDGQEELAVWDRADERLLLFRWEAGGWRWLPAADTLFPTPFLRRWVLLRDFDGDGDKDLFTDANSNLRVFQNLGGPQAKPRWRLYANPLISDYMGYPTALYCAATDVPAIDDVDGDGDIDLLVYDVLGSLIEWHRNLAQELFGRRDTLVLRLQTSCWGKVFERYDNATNSFSFIPYECEDRRRPEGRLHHAGGTLLTLDLNGDGLKDLIVGDDGPPYLIAGLNVGSAEQARIDPSRSISPYPLPNPVSISPFPAAYYEEVTGDGRPDLLAANNSPAAGEDWQSLWLYPNEGRPDSPAWTSPLRGWLQNTMLDIGTAAHPTLADLTGDGYPELILTCERFHTDSGPRARAWLFLGGPQGLTLIDSNWLNLPTYTLANPIIAVGNVVGDERLELVMGTSTGQLWLWRQVAPNTTEFSLVSQSWLSGPSFAAPLLYDYDQDGRLDILVGGRNGQIALYRQAAEGMFQLVTDFLGQIRLTDTLSTFVGFTRPALLALPEGGPLGLLVGNLTGFLRLYQPDWQNPQAAWPMIGELAYPYGRRASPTVWQRADTFVLLVGQLRGGCQAFMRLIASPPSGISSPAFAYKPYWLRQEPSLPVRLDAEEPLHLRVYNSLGQEILRVFVADSFIFPPLAAGFYYLFVETPRGTFWDKIAVW
ncbi:MAG: VCBS repeat-containing protein [Bacteroidia bacterium]|nr:VCBS repeat-containing protein [Bacteroidia bacterium]MDW8089286.1 VCBS repeat-containing protein [Bacteroidia bacterium]